MPAGSEPRRRGVRVAVQIGYRPPVAPRINSTKARLLGPLYRPLRRTLQRIKTAREFRRDRRLYVRYAGSQEAEQPARLGRSHLEAQLTKDYHRVEKGLALREPRRPFGLDVIERLEHHARFAGGEAYGVFARDAISALREWNSGSDSRGLVAVQGEPALQLDPDLVAAFFSSRRSVRDFDDARVPTREVLTQATELAIGTPSVCNRQAWRVTYLNGDGANEALALQNGNAGFRESVPWVAVVTVDTRLFAGPGERNQPWVDGGLFAMTLVWALHAVGVASCLLNWSMANEDSDRARKVVGVPDHEVIITFVAIGYPRDGHLVARSPRRPVSEVARFWGSVDID